MPYSLLVLPTRDECGFGSVTHAPLHDAQVSSPQRQAATGRRESSKWQAMRGKSDMRTRHDSGCVEEERDSEEVMCARFLCRVLDVGAQGRQERGRRLLY